VDGAHKSPGGVHVLVVFGEQKVWITAGKLLKQFEEE
jgi:hypothetical protein